MIEWKQWSYKKRNKGLLVLALLFLVLAYFLSLSATAGLYFQNSGLREKAGQVQDAPRKIAALEKQLAYWDKLANSMADTASTMQNELFKRVGKACDHNQSVLRSLEFLGAEQKENYKIDTYEVEMEGAYNNLVEAVHQLENDLGKGILSSVTFEVETDRYTKRSFLTAKLYIQSVK